jgi:hypothetical protein
MTVAYIVIGIISGVCGGLLLLPWGVLPSLIGFAFIGSVAVVVAAVNVEWQAKRRERRRSSSEPHPAQALVKETERG